MPVAAAEGVRRLGGATLLCESPHGDTPIGMTSGALISAWQRRQRAHSRKATKREARCTY
jgi:hypothetical protein